MSGTGKLMRLEWKTYIRREKTKIGIRSFPKLTRILFWQGNETQPDRADSINQWKFQERGKDETSKCIRRFNPETESVEPQQRESAAFCLLKPLMMMSLSDLIVPSWTTKNLSNADSLCVTNCRLDPLKLQRDFCLFEPANHRSCLSASLACHSYALTSTELRVSHSNESPACYSESCVEYNGVR